MTEDRAPDALRERAERRIRDLVDSPIGNRCVVCGHVKHNDLGYCQNGECGCSSGCTVAGLAGVLLRDLPALLAAEQEKALLAVQSYSEAELAAERERGRVDGLREAHRQILGLLGSPAPEALAEPAPGEEPEAHPCGHADRTPGCGGCDPGAIEYVRDDGGPWRRVP